MGTVRIEKMPQVLEDGLKEKAPELGVKKILSVEQSIGGNSSESYWVKAETDKGEENWVMRMEPPGGVLEPYNMPQECGIQEALSGTDVPVAKPLFLEEDASRFGGRFMLMEFIEGEVHTYNDPFYDEQSVKDHYGPRFVEMLAKIHKKPPPAALEPPKPGLSLALSEVMKCKRRYEEIALLPHPLTLYALKRLEEEAPDDKDRVIVHGDYRLSNIIWRDGEIAAVLDWERAFIGDPMAEIAFDQLEGLHGWSCIKGDYLKMYSKLTGFEVDEKRLAYYRLLEFLKVVLVGLSGPAVLSYGRSWDMRLFSVGTAGMTTEALLLDLIAGLD
jgi:aminoglycoside phosphotransferase (APT) family kinase protein